MRFLINIVTLLLLVITTSVISKNDPRLVVNGTSHLGKINDLVFSTSGKLISVSDDKTIRIWDIEHETTPQVIRTYSETGFEGRIYTVDISPDNRFLAVGGYFKENEIRIIDLLEERELATLKGHKNVIHSIKFNSTGTLLASAGADSNILIWNINSDGTFEKSPASVLQGHKSSIYNIAFFSSGDTVVSCSTDGSVRIWPLKQDSEPILMTMHIDKVNCLAISKSGGFIISGGNKGDLVLWDKRGNYIKKYNSINSPISALAFSSTGQLIVGSKYLGILESPNDEVKPLSIDKSRNVTAITTMKNLTAYSWGNGHLKVYNHETEQIDFEVKASLINSSKIGLMEDGILAFGNDSFENNFDYGALKFLWNQAPKSTILEEQLNDNGYSLEKIDNYVLSTGFQGKVENIPNIDGAIRSFSILDEQTIAVGSDFTLKLYTRKGEFLKELKGHNGSIIDMVFDKERKLLITICGDYTIRAWNINSGVNEFSLFISDKKEWVSWNQNGYYEASAGGEKFLGWQIDDQHDQLSEFYTSSTFRSTHHKLEGVTTRGVSKLSSNTSAAPKPKFQSFSKIEWIEPKVYKSKTDKARFSIKAIVHNQADVESLKIIINGRTLPKKRSTESYRVVDGNIHIEETIDLISPVNEVQILVKGENINSISETRVVKSSGDLGGNRGDQSDFQMINLTRKPNLYMVSIGISKFKNRSYNLSYADDDATSLSNVFSTSSNNTYNKIEVKKLIDESATKNNVLDAFQWLSQSVQANDVACLYIASHGFNKNGEFFILPHDGSSDNLEGSTIRWKDLSELLSKLPGKVIVFLDACHSGKLGTNFNQYLSSNTEAIREISSEENGVVIMSASTGSETALESEEWGHGAFTLALIEGLKEGKADIKKDGIIYLPELDFYVSERTIELTNGHQHPTTQKPSTISRLRIF